MLTIPLTRCGCADRRIPPGAALKKWDFRFVFEDREERRFGAESSASFPYERNPRDNAAAVRLSEIGYLAPMILLNAWFPRLTQLHAENNKAYRAVLAELAALHDPLGARYADAAACRPSARRQLCFFTLP